MIFEECTNQVVNITRLCIRGMDSNSTDFTLALFIVLALLITAYVLRRLLFPKNTQGGKS
ncbi:hypothetical protein LCGC14_2077030 [marine sediment metagenome]|uniref:Uncharacterized protein n=1 Tax=marine sediment metagenome TaxID=412755 RepID=A0A0F9EGX0_9ZZZZ